jgi:antitoxin (DNA-binding transcriptional repressor) of toxin-antitoxin stability system
MTMTMFVSVTAFKARCLELFDRLQTGEIDSISVTRRGKIVAVVESPETKNAEAARAVHGSMADQTIIPVGLDLTAPIFSGSIDAEDGVIHR